MTYPLSQTQMGIYVSSINAKGEGKYNINLLYKLTDGVDIERLVAAIDKVLYAHPTLFARLANDDEGNVVFESPLHLPQGGVTLVMDVNSLDDVRDRIGADYDLMHDRLFRTEIYKTPEGAFLYLDMHHIISDGMTMIHFLGEIGEVYDGGQPHAEPKNIFDLNLEEEVQRKSEAYAEAKAWYKDNFAAASGIDSLPQSNVHNGEQQSEIGVVERLLNIDTEALVAFCKKDGIRPSNYYTAAFAFLLSKYAGNEEVLFSTIYHGRPNKEDHSAYSMMVKTLPVYQSMEAATTVIGLIHRTSEQITESRKRTCYSFADIHQDLGLDANIMFAYQGTMTHFPLMLDGKEQHNMNISMNIPGMAINVKLVETDKGPVVQFGYQTDKYSRELIEDMTTSFEKILSEFLVREKLSEVSIVSAEQQALLDTFHTVATAEVPFKRFYEPIQYWAEKTPDAKALVACDRTLTYREFDLETNRVANALIERGVQPGDRVVLLLPRTSQVMCCIFGVSKAGAAYIPCDPAYPADRISLILEDSEAKYVITTEDHLQEHGQKAILVNTLFDHINVTTPLAPSEAEGERGRGKGAALAYLIYTSGSTGRPKGVMLRHEAICNYLYNHPANRHIHALVEGGVKAYLCLTTLSFDMSLKEFGVALHNGLTCVLANEDETENPVLLADLIKRNGVEALNATPSRLLGYMEMPEFEEAVSHCKVIMSGGEKYSPVLLDKLHSIKGLRIFNTYGPTEITVSSNAAELTHTDHITIGQPLLNYHEWVVDADGNELPVGVVGELYIGGIGVAAGYNNLPEKTAEAFIEYGGMRAYKSGDYARWTRDGHIEVLGRKDGQIKLHGLRIEIGEIESCINKYPGIKQSLVKVCHINDDDFLVAYFTATEQIDVDSLKAEISTTLTHYMVPSAFMQLEAFPLTPNGKTDVKNLPTPSISTNVESTRKVVDASEMDDLEKELYDIIAGALKLPLLKDMPEGEASFGINDTLTSVGLSSLSAIKVATLIYKRFGIQLKLQSLTNGASLLTIKKEILTSLLSPKDETTQPVFQQTNVTTDSLPTGEGRGGALTFAQTGVYIDCLNNPDTTLYNVPSCITFAANVTAEELVAAVKATIENHQSLKLTFTDNDGEPCQVLNPDMPIVVPVKEMTEADFVQYEKDFVRPFDLVEGPLFRFEIVNVTTPLPTGEGSGERLLLMDIHHLVTDGGSNDIIRREIAARLNGEAVESENYSYLQFAADQKAGEEGEEFRASKEFFHSRLYACESTSEITADKLKDEAAAHTQGWSSCPVDLAVVEDFAKQLGVTPMSVFLAASYYAVSRFVNDKHVYLGTISNGRNNLRTYNTTGMFVNTLALSSEIGEQTVSEFIRETAENFSQTLEHEQYPFAQIVADYGFRPEILFEYQVGVTGDCMVRGEKIAVHGLTLDLAKFKIKIVVIGNEDGGHDIKVGYDESLYTPQTAECLSLSLGAVVDHFVSQPEALVKNISILSKEQASQVDTFHTVATAEVPFKRFYEPIQYWAEKTPDAKALVACDRTLTYREFDLETNRVANALIDRGVQPGDRIVLLLPRTSQVMCCIFGVSKAGAAYIPCDPAYPADRISLILEDSEAKYVITTEDHLQEHGQKAILVNTLFDHINVTTPLAPSEAEGERGRGKGAALAYLIYTSGSTGRPKGVMLRHEAICNYLYNHPANRHIHALVEGGVKAYLCLTTLSFDMSLKEFGVALHNGLTCVLANEDETENPVLLAELIKRNGVEALNATPSRLLGYMEMPEFEEAVSHCKVIMSGGEKYSSVLLDKLHSIPGLRIFNTYGPTEITVSSNAAELTHTDFITIGQPLLNYHEWVVDADGNELPVGVVGELYIGGIGVAKGYNNLPEKTAEAFVQGTIENGRLRILPTDVTTPSPYEGEGRGEGLVRIYKSGDYARWTRDGHIEVLGRKDGQIKLHGLRIEIGEIESCINKYPGIKQSLVKVCHINDDDFLVAYFTADQQIDTDQLKAEISTTLTHYMVPSAFMQMEAFPLTPNGKTDVKNLPLPELSEKLKVKSEKLDGIEPEMNDLEKELYNIVAGALKLPLIGEAETPAFGVNDSLASIGLTSLSAIKVATLIYKRFGIQLKPQALMKGASLFSIENNIIDTWINPQNPEPTNQPTSVTTPRPIRERSGKGLPLTFAQTGVYYDIVRNPGSVAYNIPCVYTFKEGITANQVLEAVKSVIAAHPILGTHFEIKGTDVVQVYPENFSPEVNVVEASEEEFEALKTDFIKPFNPAAGPLYRATVVSKTSPLGESEGAVLLFDVLHLVSDGASMAIFNRQLGEALQGNAPVAESYTYFDYAADEQLLPQSEEYAASEQFFNETLKTVDGVSNITEDLSPLGESEGASHLCFAEASVDKAQIESVAKSLGVTPAHVFLAAAYYTVSRYTNTPDVCLCTISNGRSNLRVSDTIGMFVNTIAIVSHITDCSVRDFIQKTADNFVEALEHENYPFAKVADKFGFTPTVFYQYQVGVKGENEMFEREGVHNGKAKFKFTISIEDTSINNEQLTINDNLFIQIQYDDSLYSEALAKGFASAMQSVVKNFLSAPDAPLKQVSMLTAEQEELISTFHETKQADVPIQLYHKLFEKSVEEHCDEVALVALNPFTNIYSSFTYSSLNEHMNRIAHSLIDRGVKVGDRIALLLPRTSRLIMSQYGVLKAGGAYIPCDPKYPTERINLILEDSEAKYIITTRDRLEEFPGRALDVEELLINNEQLTINIEAPEVSVQPDDLAYLIYTSGSTGRPKGVQLMHKGVCNYHHPDNIIQSCLKNECHAALGITTISFDMSVWETGSPLMLGKTLVLVGDDDCNDPNRLAMLINDYGIDCMTATTSRFMQLLESPAFEEAFSKHIHLAYQGGEGLSMALLRKLQSYPNVRIFNGYGPTETIANSHASELTHDNIAHIGKPCVNYTNFIIDNDGNELPVGVVGELVIGGKSVAKGYSNLPEQTAAKFVDYKGMRVYKSGDYARWLPDGNVMVLGRKDNQVKLRGLRIELGEVETAITKVSGVKNVAVMIKKLAGKDHLCAYFTADRPIEIDDMKAEISQTLTHYMVPSAYLQMDAFPLTPNGKTDVKHLPEPVLAKVGGNYVAPRNKAEQDFCEIFAVILDMDKVSAADSFFELGGSSLTATRVVIEATNRGYSVSYAEVFKNPTAQQLAAFATGETFAEIEVDHEIVDYDYTKIDALLAENNLDNFVNGERLELGDVILTGANGYLGIHILHNLLENHLKQHPEYKVYCLVRHGRNGVTSEARLRNLLFYYFEKSYKKTLSPALPHNGEGAPNAQVIVIDGDVTDKKAFEQLEQAIDSSSLPIMGEVAKGRRGSVTLINCAAIVKHFSEGTEIEDINVGGLQNCVDFCLKTGSRLIQTSTGSTAGKMPADQVTSETKLTEQTSYIGQSLPSKYGHSKFIAERIVFEAIIEKGLIAKVVRLGNLSPRATDGEFQINFRSNSSMGRLHIFQMLGAYGYSNNEKNMEFSPIDETAEAVLRLSQTPKECVVFHPVNNHYILLGDVVREMAHTLGISIEEVEDDVFQQKLQEAGQDPEKAKILQSMLAYAGGKDNLVYIGTDNRFTNRVLSRLGFHWNVTSWDYVQTFIKAIAAMDFFEDRR